MTLFSYLTRSYICWNCREYVSSDTVNVCSIGFALVQFVFVMLENGSRASHMLGKLSATQLHLLPSSCFNHDQYFFKRLGLFEMTVKQKCSLNIWSPYCILQNKEQVLANFILNNIFPINCFSWVWLNTPLIPEGRGRCTDLYWFKANLVYIASEFQTTQGYMVRPYLKK